MSKLPAAFFSSALFASKDVDIPVSDVDIPGVLSVSRPRGVKVPVVFDSPHSGADYPADFGYSCDLETLQHAEDSYVDGLFDHAPACGVTFLKAHFPRSYIDVNRCVKDIDVSMLDEAWPYPVHLSRKGRAGMGLVRRLCKAGLPMYNRPLTAADIAHRITRYYNPYHRVLKALLDEAHHLFGMAWHINCHSMPSSAVSHQAAGGNVIPAFAHWQRADFVLGDRDGTTCSRRFLYVIRDVLKDMGYSVRVNDPFKGAEIIQRHGRPHCGRHSLQLEVNRHLYMDQDTRQKHKGFETLRQDMYRLAHVVTTFARSEMMAVAAD